MKGLDEWITGGIGHKTIATFKCENNHKWQVDGYTEYGMFEPDVEELIDCPVCGKPDKAYEY